MIVLLAPSPAVVDLARAGKTVDAIKAFRALEHRLPDGTEIVPGLRVAKLAVDSIRKHGLTIPMAVDPGDFSIRDRAVEAAAEEARAEKSRRFAEYAAQDGITIGGRYGAYKATDAKHVCDVCKETHPGVVEVYAPDAMGFPTVVLYAGLDC